MAAPAAADEQPIANVSMGETQWDTIPENTSVHTAAAAIIHAQILTWLDNKKTPVLEIHCLGCNADLGNFFDTDRQSAWAPSEDEKAQVFDQRGCPIIDKEDKWRTPDMTVVTPNKQMALVIEVCHTHGCTLEKLADLANLAPGITVLEIDAICMRKTGEWELTTPCVSLDGLVPLCAACKLKASKPILAAVCMRHIEHTALHIADKFGCRQDTTAEIIWGYALHSGVVSASVSSQLCKSHKRIKCEEPPPTSEHGHVAKFWLEKVAKSFITHRISAYNLYDAYCKWCESRAQCPLAVNSFGSALLGLNLGIIKKRAQYGTFYCGVKLLP